MPKRRKVGSAVRVTLYLDSGLVEELEAVASRAGVSLSELVRRSLEVALREGVVHRAAGMAEVERAGREAQRGALDVLAERQLARRLRGIRDHLRALAPQLSRLLSEAPRLDERNLRALLTVAELLRRGGRGAVEYEVALPGGEVLRYSGPISSVPREHREKLLAAAGELDLFFTRYKRLRGEFFRRVYYRVTELLSRHRGGLPPELAQEAERLAREAVGIVESVVDELDPLLTTYEALSADAAQAAREAAARQAAR